MGRITGEHVMRSLLFAALVLIAGCGKAKDGAGEPSPAAPVAGKPPEKKAAEPDIVFGTARELMDDTARAKGKGFVLLLHKLRPDGKSLRDHVGGSVEMSGYNDGVRVEITLDLRAVKTVPNVKDGEDVVVVFRCYKGDLKAGNLVATIDRQRP